MSVNGIEATVALCKCGRAHKTYGVRFEKVGRKSWEYTWAFPVREATAKREGYDETAIVGTIEPREDYPGCPYCGANSFVICGSCGKLNCNTGSRLFSCGWCGVHGIVSGGYDGSGIRSGGDR